MFKSCAQWPEGTVSTPDGSNVTTDKHETEEAAEAVCRTLNRQGFGGERKVFPIKTWTEPEENN